MDSLVPTGATRPPVSKFTAGPTGAGSVDSLVPTGASRPPVSKFTAGPTGTGSVDSLVPTGTTSSTFVRTYGNGGRGLPGRTGGMGYTGWNNRAATTWHKYSRGITEPNGQTVNSGQTGGTGRDAKKPPTSKQAWYLTDLSNTFE